MPQHDNYGFIAALWAAFGQAMTAATTVNGRGKTYFYYRCPRAYNHPESCTNQAYVPAEDIEENAWAFVLDLVCNPDAFRAQWETFEARERERLADDPGKLAKRCAVRIAKLTEEKENAQRLAVRGLLEPDMLASELARIADEKRLLESELENARNARDHLEMMERTAEAAFAQFARMSYNTLVNATFDQKVMTLQDLGIVFEINAEQEVRVSGNFIVSSDENGSPSISGSTSS
jgi:hypothetical protein